MSAIAVHIMFYIKFHGPFVKYPEVAAALVFQSQ
jgi:hypothetical protein